MLFNQSIEFTYTVKMLSVLHILILKSSVKVGYIMQKLKSNVTEDTIITHLIYSFKIINTRILLILLIIWSANSERTAA